MRASGGGFRGSVRRANAWTGVCAGTCAVALVRPVAQPLHTGGWSGAVEVGCGVGVATFMRGTYPTGPAPLAHECGGLAGRAGRSGKSGERQLLGPAGPAPLAHECGSWRLEEL